MAAALFTAATAFFAALVVYEIQRRHEFRSGLLTYGVFTGAAALGLYRLKAWGRSVALLIALGSAGLGTLVLLSTILEQKGPVLSPSALLIASIAVAYWLSRPSFVLPHEAPYAPRDE
jgi:uncharacterized membrane protein (DUF2068 family)